MDLADIREEIDAIDPKIKDLFLKRMDVAWKVAKVKFDANDEIYKPDRERDIINRLTADVDPALVEEYTAFIRKIMEVSRKYEYGLIFDWDPTVFDSLSGDLERNPEHHHIAIELEVSDQSRGLAALLTVIGDYGVNMEELHLKKTDSQRKAAVFELVMSGNLADVHMQKLLYQLFKESLGFRILRSF
ncbi:MAG: chorismate mutase [Clostridiales bacterium]|nr:chorismate mutase [Clostridiales bacterium]